MKYLLLITLMAVLFTGCGEDDEQEQMKSTGIQVRLLNNSGFELEGPRLRFFDASGQALQEYRDYATLADGELSEYRDFPYGGDCDIDFLTSLPDANNTFSFVSLCECICPLEAGTYLAEITDADPGEEGFLLNVTISRE